MAIALQNTPGVYNVDSLFWVPVLSESLSVKKPWKHPGYMYAQLSQSQFKESDLYQEEYSIDGSMTFEIDPVLLGVVLTSVFSEGSVSATGSGFTHTFANRIVDHNEVTPMCPLTVYKGYSTGSAQLFYDVNVSALSLSLERGGFMTVNMDLLGLNHTQIAVLTPDYQERDKIAWDVSTFRILTSTILRPPVSNFSLNLDFKIAPYMTVGSVEGNYFPQQLVRTDYVDYNMDITFTFEDQALYQWYLDATSNYDIFPYFYFDTEISSGVVNTFQIFAQEALTGDFSPVVGGAGPIDVSFNSQFESHIIPSFTLINTHDVYT